MKSNKTKPVKHEINLTNTSKTWNQTKQHTQKHEQSNTKKHDIKQNNAQKTWTQTKQHQ